MPGLQPAPITTPHPPHVLLVEASDDNREMYAFFLKHSGFAVTEAATAYDALRAIDSNPPDLVVTDLALPGIGGLDLCRELRHHTNLEATPVIALSMAQLSETDLELAADAGSNVVLSMPCLPDKLAFEIRKMLEHSRQLRERAFADCKRSERLRATSNRIHLLQQRCRRLLGVLSQEDLIDTIKSAYERLPELTLTVDQAHAMWHADRVACKLALRCLADAGWLEETRDQLYVRRN